MNDYEVYLTDAEYDTVKVHAEDWSINGNELSFYETDERSKKRIIAKFNFNNIKGFMETCTRGNKRC